MKIIIISVGKKHDALFAQAIHEYQQRVERVVGVEWHYVTPSTHSNELARDTESAVLLDKLKSDDTVWLLDERGDAINSITLSKKLQDARISTKRLVVLIGGAYGVNDAVRARADFVWSLSNLVFPHQIVRLLLVEQLYRALEIERGSGYHHI